MPTTHSREAELSCSHQPSKGGFPEGRIGAWLQCYFRCGWAFLIPYLAAYLLYAWLKGPVNPQGAQAWVPSLLHVYWFLHGLHVMLGGVALRASWRHFPVPRSPLALFWPVLPWMLLGVLFYLPGIYWEFPGDSWGHYLRINDWNLCTDVESYTGWRKSSYFLAYSFVSQLPAAQQQFWLNFYYTGMCLLVCWQYYLLMREARLSRNAAFVFVLLQALLFGNSLFSFYRYYGLASTAPAQLGAVALIRISLHTLTALRTGQLSGHVIGSVLRALACLVLLMGLMALNHPQALGLALLGLIAVAVWQIGEWKRIALLWVAVAVVVASLAMVCFWPVAPVLRDVYRFSGWMTPWYGFDIFAVQSQAGLRSIQVLGGLGFVNLAAGLWLLRRNHIAGWLTLTPVLALLCPLFAIPFATLLSNTSVDYVIVAPRMLLGIPAGMALVVVWQQTQNDLASFFHENPHRRHLDYHALLVVCLLAFLLIPASPPYHNRFWQALAITPADLDLQKVVADYSAPELTGFKHLGSSHFLTTNGLGAAAEATGFRTVIFSGRSMSYPRSTPPSAEADQRQRFLSNPPPRHTMVYAPSALSLSSAYSQAGYLSRHWLAQEVALDHATSPEMVACALQLGASRPPVASAPLYLIKR